MKKIYILLITICFTIPFTSIAEESIEKQAREYQECISDFNDIFQFDKADEYQIIDGVLFFQNQLLAYPCLKEDLYYNVPEGTTGINLNAFANKESRFKCITLPDSCVDIGYYDDYHSYWGTGDRFNTENYKVSETHPFFSAQDGVLFSKDRKILLLYPTRGHEQCYIVPEGVEKIGEYAFHCCDIEKIILPESVIEIGEGAFYESQIEQIIFNEGLLSIGDYAFSECDHLESPNLPCTLRNIGSESFSQCKFEYIALPNELEEIDTFAFWATPLQELVLPKSLTYIGDDICEWGWSGNTPLFSVYIDSYAYNWALDANVNYQIIPSDVVCNR